MGRIRVAEHVLERFGTTMAAEAGIGRVVDKPATLFRLAVTCLLLGAPIRADIACRGARALFDAGWGSAEALARATPARRLKTLRGASYPRFTERAAISLGALARQVRDAHGGDLRTLRVAGENPIRRLVMLPGIGRTGAEIFCQEVQVAWPEVAPFAGARALAVAERLGLGATSKALAKLVPAEDLPALCAGLARVDINRWSPS